MKRKNLYICNFDRTNSRKSNKTIENLKENSLFPNCPICCEGCGGISSSLSYHTSRFSIIPSFRLGEVPNNSTQDPQCIIDSSAVVLGRPTVFFFPFALASKGCLEVFPDAMCLHGQTI